MCGDLSIPVGTGVWPKGRRPPRLVAWRGRGWRERDVVERGGHVLDAVVVRPALVYGGEHAIGGSFFGPVLEAGEEGGGGGTVRLSGFRWKPGSRPGSRSRCTTWPMGFGAWLRSCRWFRGRASLSGVRSLDVAGVDEGCFLMGSRGRLGLEGEGGVGGAGRRPSVCRSCADGS